MKRSSLFFVSFVFLFSCVKEDNLVMNPLQQEEIVVLKERDPNIPWSPNPYQSMANRKGKKNLRSSVTVDDFLGYTFKTTVYPYEDSRNLGYAVVDMDKLKREHPSYISSWVNNTSEAYMYSYSSFDRYTSNTSVTKKVEGGGGLNLGLFSIGSKKSYKDVFTNSVVEEANSVFGELNVILRATCHRLQMSSNIKNQIKGSYLLKEFKDELYNTHPSEFFSNFGGFVLTNYTSGGKAAALYVGSYKEGMSDAAVTKESNLTNEINASFNLKVGSGGVNGNLILGRGSSSEVSVTEKFQSVRMTVKTVGGSLTFPAFSPVKEINATMIDLSSWLASLKDKGSHSIVEIADESLVPIIDFIPEENIRNMVAPYYATGVPSIQSLKEPYIWIGRNILNGLYLIRTSLMTRYGSALILKDTIIDYASSSSVAEKAAAYLSYETDRIKKMTGMKIVSATMLDAMSNGIQTNPFIYHGFCEEYLSKFVYDGTVYILSNYIGATHPQAGKYALAIHSDRFLDEYAMRGFVNRLPSVNMDIQTLFKNYTIIAL